MAHATSTEVSAVNVNTVLAPILDVLDNAQFQPLGVRARNDDPQEASQYSTALVTDYKDAGLMTCGVVLQQFRSSKRIYGYACYDGDAR